MVQTQCGLSVKKVVDVVSRFPSLHAYGVGFDIFRELPEQYRMRGMDYAKYMLAYKLDDEIDACVMFLRAARTRKFSNGVDWVRCSYLLYVYSYWRRLHGHHPVEIPNGCMAVAALLVGQRVTDVPSIRPDYLVSVTKRGMKALENYLMFEFGMEAWPDERKRYVVVTEDDRVGEQGNEPRSADAVEDEKGE